MATQQPQPNAVNISPERIIRAEMARRGFKTGDVARAIGLVSDTVTNVLCGKRHLSARRAIEDFLGVCAWSSPEEFAARQKTEGNQMKPRFSVPDPKPAASSQKQKLRSLSERFAGQLAAMDNIAREWQEVLGAIGITPVAVIFDGAPNSPFWNTSDPAGPFATELAAASAGEFDSALMTNGCYVCFYYASKSQFAKTLSVLKKGLETHGLLDHGKIFFIESETGTWVTCWPATAERI